MPKLTHKQLVAASVLVMLAIAFILGKAILNSRGRDSGIKFIEADVVNSQTSLKDESNSVSSEQQDIYVHVTGKVKYPNVYRLTPESHVIDAIKAAGGVVGDADLENINLAQKLTDGVQIYIAAKGKIPPPVTSILRGGSTSNEVINSEKPESGFGARPAGPVKLKTPGQGTVNINTAGLEELQRLPGIGPSMAKRIVDYRTQNGGFKAVDELDEVNGIGPAKLGRIRPFVTL